MIELVNVVKDMKESIKRLYKKDPADVNQLLAIKLIEKDKVADVEAGDELLIDRLRVGVGQRKLLGVVVGRMVAKYHEKLVDNEGNPQIKEKAILVSGRMFSSGQTYVVIVPCHEHRDARNPLGDTVENAEPKKMDLFVPGITSPDAVKKQVTAGGHVQFLSVQFGEETVFDSRRGDTCMMDPIIQGVINTGGIGSAV